MRNHILIIMTLVKAFCPVHRELGLGADISERMEPQVVLPETLCHSEQMADPMMTCATLHRLPPSFPHFFHYLGLCILPVLSAKCTLIPDSLHLCCHHLQTIIFYLDFFSLAS